MNHDSNTFQNTDIEWGINDCINIDSTSKDVVDAIRPASSANWAWAQPGDSYDWMDWHSPSAAVTHFD
ncbi:hypothetical protein [Paraburkholderia sp. BL10I2N1]|uniref:hypothetical protein n=1 Tax=Paraburkholderia sp. BL10I2N1 TaxID=1938796 RepID=UPI00105FD906|nr:hypothetical protein [Paraburkholderia sp. BL10I2N1]TDN62074.1 hypothetical protein B0G77_5593 [Paraburkholderia sp. BL10I2N1]